MRLFFYQVFNKADRGYYDDDEFDDEDDVPGKPLPNSVCLLTLKASLSVLF